MGGATRGLVLEVDWEGLELAAVVPRSAPEHRGRVRPVAHRGALGDRTLSCGLLGEQFRDGTFGDLAQRFARTGQRNRLRIVRL